MFCLSYLIKRKFKKYKYYNIKKIVKKINPYISYFKLDRRSKKGKVFTKMFPNIKESFKKVNYNSYQVMTWIKLTYGIHDDDDIQRLFEDENISLFGIKIDDMETFIDIGRKIGNTTYLWDNVKIYPPKFSKIVESIYNIKYSRFEKKLKKIYKVDHNKDLVKTKSLYKEIKQYLVDNENNIESSVVYSNFDKGGLIDFENFLKVFDIKYEKLMPEYSSTKYNSIINDFKNQKIKILLLHKSYTTGISIYGARQLHILEPLLNISEFMQLKARVVRYKGHMHLPEDERNVKIYKWYCSCEDFYGKLVKLWNNIKGWFEQGLYIIYFKKESKFNQDMTPDNIIYSQHMKGMKDIQDLDYYLKQYSVIDRKELESNCIVIFI